MRALASGLSFASLLAVVACGGTFESGAAATGAGGAGGAGATSTGAGGAVTTPIGTGGAGQGGATTVTSPGGAGQGGATTTIAAGGAGGASTTTGDCGDGTQDPGEECDDGNGVDSDACTNACTKPRCGDGIGTKGELCFAVPASLALTFGAAPRDVKLADLDGDQVVDLVVSEGGLDRAEVLRGKGGGVFASKQTLPIAKPYRLAVGPLSGAKPDVVVASFNDSLFKIFRNVSTPGAPAFEESASGVADGAGEISIGKTTVNGGAFAMALQGASQVLVAEVGAAGTIIASQQPVVTSKTTSALLFRRQVADPLTTALAVGSLEDAGELEIRYASGASFAVLPSTSLVAGRAISTAGADFNEDGFTDLVVVRGGDVRAFNVVLSAANGTLDNTPNVHTAGVASNCGFVVSADFDRDDHADLAISCMGEKNAKNGLVAIFLGDGHGDFVPGPVFEKLPAPLGLDAADVNDDGFPDLAVALVDTDTVMLALTDP